MAKTQDLPGFALKRKILFGPKTTRQRLLEAGKQFMEAGRSDDALEFFRRAEAPELAEQVAEKAASEGNVPLMMRARTVSGHETAPAQWLEAAQKAEAAGRPSCAKLAYEQLGRSEDADRMAGLIPGPPTANRDVGLLLEAVDHDGEEPVE